MADSSTPAATDAQRQFIDWQLNQNNATGPGTIAGVYQSQGVDPYTNPDVLAMAQGELDRAQRRTDSITQGGGTVDPYYITPWTVPTVPTPPRQPGPDESSVVGGGNIPSPSSDLYKTGSTSQTVVGPAGYTPTYTPPPEYKLPDIQQLQVAKMAASIAPNFNPQQVGADSMKAPVATAGNYASNLIRSLRSAGPGTGSSNPGVKMMPNQPNMDSAINILRAPPSGLAFNPPKLTLGGTGETPVHTPANFDWQAYLKYNPALVDAGITTEQAARDHYNNYGYKEGLRLGPTSNVDDWSPGKLFDKSAIPADFDWQAYLMLNPALGANGIDTEIEAMRHYALYGKTEGRPYQTAPSDPWVSSGGG